MEDLRKVLTALADEQGIDLAQLAARARSLPPRGGDRLNPATFRRERNEVLFNNPKRLPPKFRHADISADTFDPRLDRWLQMWADDKEAHSHLLLSGSVGTGKTWHLVALLKELVQHHADEELSPTWQYVSHSALSRKMREFDNDPGRLLDSLIETKILAFDDLGTALNREYGLEWLIELIDARSAQGGEVVTLYATNIRVADLAAPAAPGAAPALDGRIASRLLEGENVIIMDGADRRRATVRVIG